MNIKFLTSKEVRQLLGKIKEYYGILDKSFFEKLIKEYEWLITKQNKIYIVNKKVIQVFTLLKNVQNMGVYILKLEKDGIRFSIEGSQLFGPYATKNVVEISEEEKYKWLQGIDLTFNKSMEGYVILKCKNDFLGSGKVKNGKIINYVPKNRRIYI